MKKFEYQKLVGKRLNDALEASALTQAELCRRFQVAGSGIGQSTLSKIFSGDSLSTYAIIMISEELGLDISDVLSTDKSTKVHTKKKKYTPTNTKIITDARNDAFRGYLNKYHAYFYTTKNEDNIHEGIFELFENEDSHECDAVFRFKTGQRNEEGDEYEKTYVGNAFYSQPMRSVYCNLRSDVIGEISYLIFHHDYLVYQPLESRIAVAITVSSGTSRLPTMHKLLLTRNALTREQLSVLRGQLNLNASEILISEPAFNGFLQDENLPNSFFQYFGTDGKRFINSVASVNYYSFNESFISDSFIPQQDKTTIICLLRRYSSAPRYNKVSMKSEEIVYKFLFSQMNHPLSEEEEASWGS